MNGSTATFTLLALLGLTTAANARPAAEAAPVPAADAGQIQLAQRAAEVYYDQYGREVLVDAVTGEVIAINPRRDLRPGPAERRRAREQELRGDTYERRVPLGELLRRELDAHLGRDGADPDYSDGRDYRRQQRDRYPREGYPLDRFPEAPVLAYPDEGGVERYPESGGWGDRAPVERSPLEEPRYSSRDRRAPQDDSSGIETPGPDGLYPPTEDGALASVPEEPGPATESPAVPPQRAVIMPLKGVSEDVTRIQVLLDREGLSPGVIDGRMGDNVNKAISAWRDKTGSPLRTYDKTAIAEALASSGGDALTEYTITAVDAAGPYVASVPEDYGEKAKLDRLGYISVTEALAERFHMDENYLKALNPGANFDRPGTIVRVANTGAALKAKVSRIVADKGAKQVRAYDAGGRLVAVYPATIGSGDTPSPSGTVSVERVAYDPEYTYNPKINFKQGANEGVLTIPPGPNGPVGSIWIALSKPTYGIHGTPEPSKIGKTFSHGCVRLTNWDAAELAGMVEKGTVVEFVE
jgi:lipoprotein-anchoring transpeptidase ErfK/SrfK